MSYLRDSVNYVWSTTLLLGKGATGFVYQGVHKKTGESVAVKTFNHQSHLRPLEVQMREFEVMRVLSHENVVKMVAIEDEALSQKKVIVMELCNSGSLYAILDDPQNSWGLEEEEFLCVLKDLTAGMKYLREKKISHRDLKPGNIMKHITECGWSVYKLTDFGAARVLDDDQQFLSFNHGTVEYLHPDMYQRAVLHHPPTKPFRATVDLWSIGVTLYHVATGSLPFRPFGGRQNKDTMYYITTEKASGVISGVQHSENGPIEWSTKLPETCSLNRGLRDLVTVLLAGILECNDKKMWTFDQFFSYVTDIMSRKVFHIFYMNEDEEICLYMQPNKKLKDLKEQINAQINVSPSSQLLLFNKDLFINQISANANVSTFPTTTPDMPLLLIHKEKTGVKDLAKLGSLSASFQAFSEKSIDTDASTARNCCSVAHAVKRLVVKFTRSRDLILRIPQILISLSFVNITSLCSKSDLVKEKFDDLKHRLELLERYGSLISQFMSALPSDPDSESKLQAINYIVSSKKKAEDQVNKKIKDLRSSITSLECRVSISRQLQNEWDEALSECSNLDGYVQRADTYVERLRDSWQVFVKHRSIRAMSAHDQQFHMLERVKVQQTIKKLLNLLEEECFKSCLQAYTKFNKWYRDMQATMVQCQRLDDDLVSITDILKKYSSSLYETESAVHAIGERIFTIRPTKVPKASSSYNDNYHVISDKVITENGQFSADTESDIALLSAATQCLKEGNRSMREATEEHENLVKNLVSMFQDARL